MAVEVVELFENNILDRNSTLHSLLWPLSCFEVKKLRHKNIQLLYKTYLCLLIDCGCIISDHNTTGCDEDFQWVQSPEPRLPPQETPDMQDLYSNNTKDPGKPVTYRSKGSLRGSRKDRDNKSKSSSVYRYHSPSRGYYADDILHANSGRNLCFNCSTSCQDIPDHSHRYGSTPGLDCHWLNQPVGCYHCHHRNITPYCCEQLYPPYRYYKVWLIAVTVQIGYTNNVGVCYDI